MSRPLIVAAVAVLSTLAINSAAIAQKHHHTHNMMRYVGIARSNQRFLILRRSYLAARPTVHYDDTPSYDDPSRFGGGEALPVK